MAAPMRALPKSGIDASRIQVAKKTPIAFKPLDIIDPGTGKPVPPTTPIHLPPSPKYPNGRTMTAGEYWEQMNRLEQAMNQQGYSFRDADKKHVANVTKFDRAAVRQQMLNIHTAPRNPKTAADLDRIVAAHRSYINQATAASRTGTAARFAPIAGAAPGSNGGGVLRFSAVMPAMAVMPKVLPVVMPVNFVPQKTPPRSAMRPDIRVAAYDQGPDNQPMLGEPGTQVLTAKQFVAVTFLGLPPPTRKFVWQIVNATAKKDNFGPNGWQAWQTPYGLMSSGTAMMVTAPGQSYVLVNFAAATHQPLGEPHEYLLRVVPVNDDGTAAALPSNPVTVDYGSNPPPPELRFPPPPPPPAPYTPQDVDRPWHFNAGDPSLAAIVLDEDMQQHRTANTATGSMSFSAGAAMLGNTMKFLEFSWNGSVTESQGPSSTPAWQSNASFKILGIEQCDESCSATSDLNHVTYGYEKDFGPDLDVPVPFAFSLGPVDVSAQAGVRGSIGVGVDISADPTGPQPFYVKAGPYLRLGGYLEAAVGIGIGGVDIVQAGVSADLTMIDFGLVFGMEGAKYYGTISRLVVLEGSLTAFTKAGLCPLCHEWDWTIVDYSGLDVLGGDPNRGLLFEGTF